MPQRCPWPGNDPVYVDYHDHEWGVPLHDERRLFEALILDGAQAGLSWITILKKRDNYRRAFDGFDAERMAAYDEAKIADLMSDRGIVRNRRKIEAAVTNARAYLELVSAEGGLDAYLWGFVDGRPVQNAWRRMEAVPATSPVSESMSRELKRRGFVFVGPTICYAFMQAAGMVNDHLVDCFRYEAVRRMAERTTAPSRKGENTKVK